LIVVHASSATNPEMATPIKKVPRIDLENPRYDQSTFEGRAKHFITTTNPLNVLASDAELDNAKAIVEGYRNKTEDKRLSADQIWAAKELYDSAFHPQTGEKLILPGIVD
jgi:hypothetical protein